MKKISYIINAALFITTAYFATKTYIFNNQINMCVELAKLQYQVSKKQSTALFECAAMLEEYRNRLRTKTSPNNWQICKNEDTWTINKGEK